MPRMMYVCAMMSAMLVIAAAAAADETHQHAPANHAGATHESDFVPMDLPGPFGADLKHHWLDPWPHSHFSRRGTPLVHLFNSEPAFLNRDFIAGVAVVDGVDGDEIEAEFELEWAFTRRIGLVIEAPLLFIDPDDGPGERGVGDVALAPRFLLVDTDTFLLSFNLEVELPTGDEDRGLGHGEVALAPSLSGWLDLGKWFTFSFQTGTEHGLESGEAELFYHAAITYSFLGPALAADSGHGHEGHHAPPGLTSLIAEFTGRTVLDGQESGRSSGELLIGVSYQITDSIEGRIGYQFPLFKPKELDGAFILGVIIHF